MRVGKNMQQLSAFDRNEFTRIFFHKFVMVVTVILFFLIKLIFHNFLPGKKSS